MADSIDPRLPSFRNTWDHLVQDRLRSSTLSVCIFMGTVPTAIFIVDLLLEIFRRKTGITVSEVVGNTLWPTVVSAIITLLAWAILLGWSFVKLVEEDKKALIAVIGERDTYIQKIGEIMGRRAEESAATINQHVRTIWEHDERIRQMGEQLSLTEDQLYGTKTALANERDRISQPDISLLWEWPEAVRMTRALHGDTEKDILVHNRSNQFIYNVQIETVPLRQGLAFDLISEIGPNVQYRAVGRWEDKSSLTSNYAYFFIGGEEEAESKGWIYKKPHNRGLTDSYFKIPMAVTYESSGIRWQFEFDFIYDVGQEPSYFVKKSGKRIS